MPEAPPILGKAIKARFPLRAKPKIENAPSTLKLHAKLYWAGEHQDSISRTIEHVYESDSVPGSFL